MTSLRRRLLVWQIVSGVGILGFVFWAVLLPAHMAGQEAVRQLSRGAWFAFVALAAGFIPSLVLVGRHRELRSQYSMMFLLASFALESALAMLIWYFLPLSSLR